MVGWCYTSPPKNEGSEKLHVVESTNESHSIIRSKIEELKMAQLKTIKDPALHGAA